jgi:PhnB protein
LKTIFKKEKPMTLNPYLNFDGQAEEAFRFYHSIFGGELYLQTMGEAPGGEELPEEEKKRIMHASISIGTNQYLMASDIIPSMGHVLKMGNNNYISITADSREEVERIFNALAVGGTIEMPLEDMFWGDYFGSLTDAFGVGWMIGYNQQQQ